MTSRTTSATQQRFTYSGLTNDLVTIADATNTIQAKYGRDPFGGLLSLQEGAGPALATISDLHGDVVATFSGTALTDSVAYDPFGEVTHRSGTARTLGYQGEYTDPDSGKVNMGARWYQPGTGGFTSRDTATLNPAPSVQANRYTYANAAPLTGSDPTGHSTVIQTGDSTGARGASYGGQAATSSPVSSIGSSGDWVIPPPMSRNGPQYNYGENCCVTFNGTSKEDLIWWEANFGDSAWLPKFKDEDAKKWHLLPNDRPMPKGMEDDFWNASEDVQNRFLLLYNVEQMYSTAWSDGLMVAYWTTINPPKEVLASGSPAPGPVDQWKKCEFDYSKKQCDAWRQAATQVVEGKWVDDFSPPLSVESEEYVRTHGKYSAFDVSDKEGYRDLIGRKVSKVRKITDKTASKTVGLIIEFGEARLKVEVIADDLYVSREGSYLDL